MPELPSGGVEQDKRHWSCACDVEQGFGPHFILFYMKLFSQQNYSRPSSVKQCSSTLVHPILREADFTATLWNPNASFRVAELGV